MSTQNGSNWKKSTFFSYILGFLTFIALAAGTANAAPSCKMQVSGSQVVITIADTGMVWSDGAQPPAGMTTYSGTGRAGDTSASCSDNGTACQSAKWFLRFADSKAGWVSDNDLGNDSRAVTCQYDPQALAQVCAFELTDGMKTTSGKVRMHFAAKLPGGTVAAAYQPQSGCQVERDGKGNPHTIVSSAAAAN